MIRTEKRYTSGDVIKYKDIMTFVKFDQGCFCLFKYIDDEEFWVEDLCHIMVVKDYLRHFEVVGNVWENKDLLGE